MILKRIKDSERKLYERAVKYMGFDTGYYLVGNSRNDDGTPSQIDLCYEGEPIDHKYLNFIVQEVQNDHE